MVEQISRVYASRLEQVLCHLFAVGQRDGKFALERPALLLARAFRSSYYGLRLLGRFMPGRAFLDDVMEGIGPTVKR